MKDKVLLKQKDVPCLIVFAKFLVQGKYKLRRPASGLYSLRLRKSLQELREEFPGCQKLNEGGNNMCSPSKDVESKSPCISHTTSFGSNLVATVLFVCETNSPRTSTILMVRPGSWQHPSCNIRSFDRASAPNAGSGRVLRSQGVGLQVPKEAADWPAGSSVLPFSSLS